MEKTNNLGKHTENVKIYRPSNFVGENRMKEV